MILKNKIVIKIIFILFLIPFKYDFLISIDNNEIMFIKKNSKNVYISFSLLIMNNSNKIDFNIISHVLIFVGKVLMT